MVKSCCIKNCKSVWIRNGEITFHSFPTDPEGYAAFTSAIPSGYVNKITKHSCICSKHFTFDSFQPMTTPSLRNRLKKKAVPTLFDHNGNSSTTTSTNAEEPANAEDADDPMEVEAASLVNAEASTDDEATSEERPANDDFVHIEILQARSVVEPATEQEIGVQTVPQYLAPSDEVIKLRSKVKILQKRLKRRDVRLKIMRDVIRHLKHDTTYADAVEDVLKKHFSGFPLDLLANELNNSSVSPTQNRYSEDIKSFALTLYFYSPKAYNFVRTKLHLPHSSLLRKWMSSCNSESESVT